MSRESLPAIPGGRASARLSSKLSQTALAMLVTVALVSLAGLFWSTRQSDRISVERQVRVAHHSIDIALDELALQQETVAIWDETALELTRPAPNRQWLFDNVGSWLNRIFAQDDVFLLDGYDRPVQSVVDGKLVPNARYMQL
jgi:sensor domain CHASE-containing protein